MQEDAAQLGWQLNNIFIGLFNVYFIVGTSTLTGICQVLIMMRIIMDDYEPGIPGIFFLSLSFVEYSER